MKVMIEPIYISMSIYILITFEVVPKSIQKEI